MKLNIKHITGICALVFAMWAALSCTDELEKSAGSVPEGYCRISVGIDAPVMDKVYTRAVDPDGAQGVQTMELFCFDSYGLFISSTRADLKKDPQLPSLGGSLTADIPLNTDRIHFFANQNLTNFSEESFRGKSEQEVMSTLEGSAGMMIYWARFRRPDPAKSMAEAIKGQTINLIRNQAKVSVEVAASVSGVNVEGFAVCNTYAFGTVAPYSGKTTSFFPSAEEFKSAEWKDIVTLPARREKLSDPVDIDIDIADSDYIYENENDSADPISVIIKSNGLYYRVMLINQEGESVKIRRNYHYILTVVGALSYGQDTFEKALTSAPTNNIWLSISDDVNTVEDSKYSLTVSPTYIVFDAEQLSDINNRHPQINVSITRKDGQTITASEAPSITWLEGNNVANYSFENGFANPVISGSEMSAVIRPTLFDLGNDDRHEGTLLVKKGKLQRKVKIIVIRKQEFAPVWITSQLDGLIVDPGESFITLMFHIPETCPEELYPFDVLITAKDLDIRNASGMQLPVINNSEQGFGEDHGVPYKYVYTVERPGDQSVFFRNVLQQVTYHRGEVWIEAGHFGTQKKEYTYTNNLRRIDLTEMKEYNANQKPDGSSTDEPLYYYLVPQKINAPVKFTMNLTDKVTGNPVSPTVDWVEFLLFAQNLNFISVDDGIIYESIPEDKWDNRGRMGLFYPATGNASSAYQIDMKTNCAKSTEVVRISSNKPGDPFFRNHNGAEVGHTYADATDGSFGNGYRSAIFRLVNYRPFRFFAEVNGVGTNFAYADIDESSDIAEWSEVDPEPVDNISLDYTPGLPVDIEFDISSFKGMDGNSVDPFGESFEIYIDAPMLELDVARLAECKLTAEKIKADPAVPGRFIYTVDASRAAEKQYSVSDPHPNHTGVSTVDRSMERKRIPFKKSSIVSSGRIVLSSDENEIVYLEKVFNVSNNLITGSIKYGESEGTAVDIPKSGFVSFASRQTEYRIGSMVMVADGQYSLKLRSEYNYNWYNDAVEIRYVTDSGEAYSLIVNSLRELYENRDIVLLKEQASGN